MGAAQHQLTTPTILFAPVVAEPVTTASPEHKACQSRLKQTPAAPQRTWPRPTPTAATQNSLRGHLCTCTAPGLHHRIHMLDDRREVPIGWTRYYPNVGLIP